VAIATETNCVPIKAKPPIHDDAILTSEEAKAVRRGEKQLKRGDSRPWRVRGMGRLPLEHVKALQGPEWKGRLRKRVGPYQLFSGSSRTGAWVEISSILVRSKHTYR
jgi:hypothetical protein